MKDTCFLNFVTVFLLQVSTACLFVAGTNITTDQAALLALKANIKGVLADSWSDGASFCSWIGVTCSADHNRVIALDLSHSTGTNITTDQAALLALKANIKGVLADSWSDGASFCSWIGVTCSADHNRVIALDLSHMGLYGTIPVEIGSLSFLASLSIRNNSFYGSPPNELAKLQRLKFLDLGINQFHGEIPSCLFKFRRLQTLSLSDNKFTGSIPTEIGNLTMLNKLHLSHNDLHGTLPWEIGYLTKLENLSISNNNITGSIPISIGNCTLLKEINLSDNNLAGVLPNEIGHLHSLVTLRIRNNVLIGSIPSVLFNVSTMKAILLDANCLSGILPSSFGLFLPNLVELRLGENELEGIIPSSISNASRLAVLDLSNNSFSGFVPSTLGNLRYLEVLNLANNHLTSESSAPESSFFTSLTSCKNLRVVSLSGNQLNSTLPVSIGNLSTSLEQLWASNCNYGGGIPSEIGNLTSLIALGLANNDLTDNIPATIGKLKKLQVLHLQGNKLQGGMTYDLCQLENLGYFFLGANKISGLIPDCLGNISTLRHLDLSSNSLTSGIPLTFWSLNDILAINMSSNFLSGPLSFSIGKWDVVESIDLSNNRLSGEIPSSIGILNGLTYLSLAKNVLQGPLPDSLVYLVSLEFFDISCNNLSGRIPKKLEELLHLKYFNVSFNGLEGEIPSKGPFTNFSAQSYTKNKALCGAPELQVPTCKVDVPGKSVKIPAFLFKIILPPVVVLIVTVTSYFIICHRKPKKRNADHGLPKKLRNFVADIPYNSQAKIFSYIELQRATDGFSEGNLLGKGNFGSVYKGKLKNGLVVAIKVFDVELETSLTGFDVECKVLRNTTHPNIIRCICSCNSPHFKATVMQYIANGTLEKWLHTHNYNLNLLQRLDVMIDTAKGISYLHDESAGTVIIHCDLKPSNILLDEDMRAYVSDFSISRILNHDPWNLTRQTMILCTFGYAAPESGLNGIYSTRTDVYSFGILLMETFTGKKPTDEMFDGEMNLRRWVMESLPGEADQVVDPSLMQTEGDHFGAEMKCVVSIFSLAQRCAAESPDLRLEMKEVLERLLRIRTAFLRNISG